jgi:hypothetical protein
MDTGKKEQIMNLRSDAIAHNDAKLVQTCNRALAGDTAAQDEVDRILPKQKAKPAPANAPKFVASKANAAQPRATWGKLNSGAWGVIVQSDQEPREGQVLQVEKRDGTHTAARITRVLGIRGWGWQCEAVGEEKRTRDVAPRKSGGRAEPRESTSTRCRVCKGPIRNCSYQRAMHGMCGSCAYDEI